MCHIAQYQYVLRVFFFATVKFCFFQLRKQTNRRNTINESDNMPLSTRTSILYYIQRKRSNKKLGKDSFPCEAIGLPLAHDGTNITRAVKSIEPFPPNLQHAKDMVLPDPPLHS